MGSGSPAAAQSLRTTVAVGVDGQVVPSGSFHGIVLAALESTFASGQRAVVDLNTDTLRLSMEDMRLGLPKVRFGVMGGGQYAIAGLLPNYYQDRARLAPRGFQASWIGGAAWMKWEAPAGHFVDVRLDAARWFFGTTSETAAALVLPDLRWTVSPRVHWTWWGLEPESSLWERHRWVPRVRGVALGMSGGADVRVGADPWGARDPQAFAPVDPRNDPDETVWVGQQWLQAGTQVTSRVRLQLRQQLRWTSGVEDDVLRARVGGLTPYVVTVPGAAWPEWVVSNLVALGGSVPISVGRDWEVGVEADAVWLDDRNRRGLDDAGWVGGVGAFWDLREGPWQATLRAGWSPAPGAGQGAGVGGLLQVGWSHQTTR